MKILFKPQDVWDLVENDYADPDEKAKLKKNRRKDSKALFFIQQAIHKIVFSRITTAISSKEAWMNFQRELKAYER